MVTNIAKITTKVPLIREAAAFGVVDIISVVEVPTVLSDTSWGVVADVEPLVESGKSVVVVLMMVLEVEIMVVVVLGVDVDGGKSVVVGDGGGGRMTRSASL